MANKELVYLVSFMTMQLSMVAAHQVLFAHAAGVEIIAPTTTTTPPKNANVEVFMVGQRCHDRDILECLWGAEVARQNFWSVYGVQKLHDMKFPECLREAELARQRIFGVFM